MKYKHFILTRFNIPFLRKDNIGYLFEDKYLETRFQIFKEICFHSVEQQSNQDFIWLVFFDSRTPNRYKEINKTWSEQYKNYNPVYIDMRDLNVDNVDFYECECLKATNKENINELTFSEKIQKIFFASKISNIINSYCDDDDGLVITTRIDNDDAFHKDMLTEIKNHIPESFNDKIMLSFDNGMQYVYKSHVVRSFFYPNNHFTTLIEKRTNSLFSVFYWDHFFVEKYLNVKHVLTIPLWVEICHKTNVVNSISMTSNSKFIWGTIDLSDYGINSLWKSKDTLVYLFLNPSLYIIPKIKFMIKKFIR